MKNRKNSFGGLIKLLYKISALKHTLKVLQIFIVNQN
jgi:hypothetical protein